MKITTATAIGFAVMGFIGFFVRLVHIPINRILLGTYFSQFEEFNIGKAKVGLRMVAHGCAPLNAGTNGNRL
jgi:hypothetical protein